MARLSVKEIATTMRIAGFYPHDAFFHNEMKDGKLVTVVTNKALQAKVVVWLDTAIAICLAESGGGDPAAKNPGSSASGLWQIMYSVHKAKIRAAVKEMYAAVEFDSAGRSDEQLVFDPLINTVIARMVYRKDTYDSNVLTSNQYWKPWEVYNTGAYKKYLGHGKEAYEAIFGQAATDLAYQNLQAEFMEGQNAQTLLTAATPGLGAVNAVTSGITNVLNFVKSGAVAVGIFVLGLVLLALGVWFVLNKPTPSGVVKAVVK